MHQTFSVIIPFYNEPHICENYKIVKKFLRREIPDYEIILVNDGSSEKIVGPLRKVIKSDRNTKLINYTNNQGRGYAAYRGFKESKGAYAAYIDSDLEINPIYLKDIKKALQESDVAIGSKLHPKSKVKTRKVRRAASFIFNSIIRVFLQSNVHDHHVGLKGFRRKVLSAVLPYIKERRWAFDVEILYLSQRKQFSVVEIPISMTYGLEQLKLSYGKYFWDLFIFIANAKKRYKKFLSEK